MIKILFGLFIITHGLVHLLYTLVLLGVLNPDKEGIPWNGKSWILSSILMKDITNKIGIILYGGIILLFVISGLLFLFNNDISGQMIIYSSLISTITILLFWDGNFNKLIEKGLIGITINIGLIIMFSTNIELINKYVK